MGINRIKLANGMTNPNQGLADPKLTARQVAEQNPELDAMRQKFFGTNYLDDIDQGNTGTVQYYSGLGNPNNLQFTPPVVEIPAVDTSTPVVDGGGGGGGGGVTGISTGNETGNTAEQQRLLDAGIGVQAEPGAPISAPGEGMLTQQAIDELADYPLNTSYDMTGGITGDNIEVGIPDNESGFIDPLGTISGAPVVGDFDNPTTGTISDNRLNEVIGGQPMAAGPFDYLQEQTPLSQVQVDGGLSTIDEERLSNYTPSFETQEQTNAINNAFNSIKDAGAAGVDKLKDNLISLGGKLKPGFDGIIEIGGRSIDIGKSIASGIISYATGVPLLGNFISNLESAEPQQGAVSDQFEIEGSVLDDIGRIQQVGLDYDTPENVMAGYSPGETGLYVPGTDFSSAFTVGGGTIQESIVDRLQSLEKTKNEKYGGSFYNANGTPKNNPDTGEPTKLGQREEALKENLNTTARAAGAVTLDGPQYTTNPDAVGYSPFSNTLQAGTVLGPGEFLPEGEDLVTAEELAEQQFKNEIDAGIQAPTNVYQDNNDGGGGGGGGGGSTVDSSGNVTDSSGQSQGNINDEFSQPGSGDGGGDGGRDDSKIVCTMMNESYGFGSFRNKIWMKFHKDIAPEYQKGYHKIFLPLVKLSKTNKIIKKVLEHIAVHSTIDMRQATRGKTHLLGRVYRKIILPLCYWAGKND